MTTVPSRYFINFKKRVFNPIRSLVFLKYFFKKQFFNITFIMLPRYRFRIVEHLVIMLAVWRLKEKAYAVPIREQIQKVTGKTWAFGALFVMLNRLEKKGFLESRLADPLPKRGGRSKRIYTLSPEGIKALEEVKDIQASVWTGIEDFPIKG